jgi:hypothetical protein
MAKRTAEITAAEKDGGGDLRREIQQGEFL